MRRASIRAAPVFATESTEGRPYRCLYRGAPWRTTGFIAGAAAVVPGTNGFENAAM